MNIVRLNLILPAQNALPQPPLGPFIAQKGVPGPAFCEEFNTLTKKYPKDAHLNVSLIITGPKKYKIIVRGFNISAMLRKSLNIKKLNVESEISMEQVDTIVSEYNKYFLDKGIKKKIISVLRGTGIKLLNN